MTTPTKPRVNFKIIEEWEMECPECLHEQNAPFNIRNPMWPMDVECEECGCEFVLTYDRNASPND